MKGIKAWLLGAVFCSITGLNSSFAQTNDFCTNAVLLLPGAPQVLNIASATTTGDPTTNSANNLFHGVWYKVSVTNGNERVNIQTCGSGFDTKLAVYSGICGSLTEVAGNDTGSMGLINSGGASCSSTSEAAVSFSATNGDYYVLAGGSGSSAVGNLHIAVDLTLPPTNDACGSAIMLTDSQTSIQNNFYATEIGDPSAGSASGLYRGLWYKVTVPVNGMRLNVKTCNSGFNTKLVVYSGSCGNWTEVAGNDTGSINLVNSGGASCGSTTEAATSFTATNTDYYILAGSGNQTAFGMLQVNVDLTPAPTNDVCNNAITLTNGQTSSQNNFYATEYGDPSSGSASGLYRGLWYKVTVPVNGMRLNVKTCGSGFNTKLAVYTGNCGSWTEVAGNDTGSINLVNSGGTSCGSTTEAATSFTAINTDYYILAGGGNETASGMLQVNVDLTPAPTNDFCNGAITLTNGQTIIQNNFYATEYGDPTVGSASGLFRGLWYKVTVTNASQRLTVKTCGSGFNTKVAVYTGNCGAWTEVAGNDTGSINFINSGGASCGSTTEAATSFSATNTDYYILAGSGNETASGMLQVNVNLTPAPTNDVCSGAVTLTNGQTFTQNNFYATEAGDYITGTWANGLYRGLWYKLRQTNGVQRVNISTCGSGFNTRLAVYTGTCDALTEVAGNDSANQSGNGGLNCPNSQEAAVSFVSASNTDYYILAGSANATASGVLQMTINIPPPTNDMCAGAITLNDGVPLSMSTTYATEAGDPVPTNCVPSLRGGVWFLYQPAKTGPVTVTTCGSDFDTVLAAYTGTCGTLSNLTCSHNPGAVCADRASVTFNASAGSNYFILAGGNNGQVGNLQIVIPIVDLVASNLTVNNAAMAGNNLSAGWSVFNQGSNTIRGNWTDVLTLSNNATNLVLATSSGPRTAPAGGSYSNNVFVNLGPIPPGAYTLFAQTDAGGAVLETNKSNNLQILFPVNVTALPPSNVTLLYPVANLTVTSCVPTSIALSAQAKAGSYAISNITYFDGATPIGHGTKPPNYIVNSLALASGSHSITAQAADLYNQQATSAVTMVTVNWPGTNVLEVNVDSNRDCVICMSASGNTNYLVETATNVLPNAVWSPLLTNPVVIEPFGGPVLIFTNHPADSRRYFRVKTTP